jgi:hypothetical protein
MILGRSAFGNTALASGEVEGYVSYPLGITVTVSTLVPAVTGGVVVSEAQTAYVIVSASLPPHMVSYPPAVAVVCAGGIPSQWEGIISSPQTASVTVSLPVSRVTFTRVPSDLFPGYESDGTDITIPIADLIGLTAEEADAVTGDWRKIVQTMVRVMGNHMGLLSGSARTRTVTANEFIQSYDYPIVKHDWQVVFRTDDSDPPDMVNDVN